MEDGATNLYDAQVVIDEAEKKLKESGLTSAQNVFQSALLDWVDDATMGDTVDQDSVRGEITKLWLAYANLNRRSNMNKSATEVYEQAVNCPVAGGVGKIWSEYAKFSEGRGRPITAQKAYLRALVGENGKEAPVKDAINRDFLWNEFLQMMRVQRKNPDLSLDVLKKAVQQEHPAQPGNVNETGGTKLAGAQTKVNDAELRPTKRLKQDNNVGEAEKIKTDSDAETLNASNIDSAANVLITTFKNMPPEIEAAWHARDGGSLASRPEPPLFTASPPKLGDPSGKDLLGDETALQLLRMLTAKTHNDQSIGSPLLELCHACWMMTAMKEEETSKARERLEKKINANTEALEAKLEASALVAGGALAAVQQANDQERNQFNMQCAIQRDEFLAASAWEFRKLLYTQQIILTSARLPGFDGPTVDSSAIKFQSNVCAVMHSAFYLRIKVGEVSHVNMLNKQLEALEKLVAQKSSNQPVISNTQPMQQAQFPTHFQAQQTQFQQPPLITPYGQQPSVYPIQQQPVMGIPPMGYQQSVPVGFPAPQPMQPGMIMQQPGQQIMQQPQQFMGQMHPQFQRGQQ